MDNDRPRERALLLVVAGPAGSGKTTLCQRLVAEGGGRIERVVTCTTRPPRAGEREGVDYYFKDDAALDRLVEEGAFLEWARVHARRYGTLRRAVEEKLERGVDLVMNVDVQGVINLRRAAATRPRLAERLATVFVAPPDMEELRRRLRERGKDGEEEILRRLDTAKREIRHWRLFDYAFCSRSKEADFADISSIFRAEKLRVPTAER